MKQLNSKLLRQKTYDINHRVKSRYPHLGSIVTYSELAGLMLKFDYRCVRCKLRLASRYYTIDHIVPLSRGGLHHVRNLQPLCMACNTAKGSQSIDYRGLHNALHSVPGVTSFTVEKRA